MFLQERVKYSKEPENPTKSCKARGSDFRCHFKDLRPGNDEIVRLRDRDLKNLLHHKKLYLMLQAVRREVLKGCKIVLSRVFPTKFQAENHHLWVMAERLGATCSTKVDPSVTQGISTDVGTEKSRWAVEENRFLIEPRWLEAANFRWQRQPEEKFLVKEVGDRSVQIGAGFRETGSLYWRLG
ncbi:hypothetical protein L6452_06803 [Arctium lappa]|uniref:Uncharacterized protein n=1 Tax=Arctium lappa TaxID=4217 RepID=A0ACB9EJG1_ARCLA|nr:hypothetical protein L6452_06803 [Arctium lappa]